MNVTDGMDRDDGPQSPSSPQLSTGGPKSTNTSNYDERFIRLMSPYAGIAKRAA
jgi:hypothetical protein